MIRLSNFWNKSKRSVLIKQILEQIEMFCYIIKISGTNLNVPFHFHLYSLPCYCTALVPATLAVFTDVLLYSFIPGHFQLYSWTFYCTVLFRHARFELSARWSMDFLISIPVLIHSQVKQFQIIKQKLVKKYRQRRVVRRQLVAGGTLIEEVMENPVMYDGCRRTKQYIWRKWFPTWVTVKCILHIEKFRKTYTA